MLSEEQRRRALEKNLEVIEAEARQLLAEEYDYVTLTYYADEESFHRMRLKEESDDFDFRQLVTVEGAKVFLSHGLDVHVQILDADTYFAWLGDRENSYEAQHEYPGGNHLSGAEALALLGIERH
ncbi:hypothetical protein [Azospirillum sp. SYSU D00513]|uniref:hypothetical protein n=1 Tax=Azospirillum sp. SYSU D00513 TaxID=2812561 RepID=UPI001A95F66A|nr:hypothetical protein [Azospirillum sp. SYSU D00513]